MLSSLLRNRKARKVDWADGKGVPSSAIVADDDGADTIFPIDNGVLIVTGNTTILVPWEKVITVQFDEAVV